MPFLKISSKKISRSNGGTAGILVFLSLAGILMVLPFAYTLIQSLKPIEEIYVYPPRFWVTKPTLRNFTSLFRIATDLWVPFTRYLFNSVFIAVAGTVLQVVFASMAAYPLSKHSFRGRGFFFNLTVVALLFTGQVVEFPQYILIAGMGLIDTFLAMLLPNIAMPLGLYLMRQNMVGFPDSVLEAARIDGAPERYVFWRIVMPNMKAVWMTVVVFAFSVIWNKSDTMYIYSEQLKSMQTLLTQIAGGGIARAGVGAATSVLMLVPPILVFLLTQRNVIESMAQSGLKE